MTTKKQFVPKRTIVPIPKNIKSRLKIVENQSKSRYIKILLSATGGQGKTAFIGTASRRVTIDGKETIPDSNLLVIEYDPQGDDTLFDMGVIADIIKPKSEKEFLDLIKWLHTSEADQYDTVALDPYNKMMDIEYDDVLKYAINQKSRVSHDPEILELRDYNRIYKRARVINELLIPLNKHLIVTCISSLKDKPSEMDKKKEDRDQIQSLMLDGKMAHLLSTQFSLHGIMERVGGGKNKKVITEFGLNNSESKTRFRFPSTQENITFPKLMELMNIKEPLFKLINWKHDEMGFTPEFSTL